MNNKKQISKQTHFHNSIATQRGNATLAMSLVLLAVVTVIGTTSSRMATNEVRMTSNSIEKQKSLIAAESAVLQAWNVVNTFSQMDFLDPCNRPGVYDLRSTAPSTCSTTETIQGAQGEEDTTSIIETSFTNIESAWSTSKTPVNWGWNDTNQHTALVDKLSVSAAQILSVSEKTDPMKLFRPPQFAIAIHEPVYRAGSTQICFPVSIIGAAKGGVEETETLIEIRAIPENSCFPNI